MSVAPLLEVRDLSIELGTPGAPLDVVHRVSFTIADGKTLGLVGESGCGKSITMLALMGLLPPAARVAGSIRLRGMELVGIYHTHPEHPAVPSDFDRDAAWPEWSYVILSVRSGEPAELRSWALVEEGGRFEEEDVEVRGELE